MDSPGNPLKRILMALALIAFGVLLSIGVFRQRVKEQQFFQFSPTWTEGEPGLPGIYFLLIMLTLVVGYGLYTNNYLYRWRRKLSSQPHLLMPEEYIEKMERFEATVETLAEHLEKDVPKIHRDINQKTNDILSSFLTLNQSLEEKEKEIRRLKKGGDLKVIDKFISRFANINDDLETFLNRFSLEDDTDSNESLLRELQDTQEMLWDAMEECDVERYSPELGLNFRHTEGLSSKTKTIPANTPEEDYQISAIEKEGYRIALPDNKYHYVKEAEVTIKRYQKQNPEEQQ